MGNSPDRILLVEHDQAIIDLIGRQALQPLGYQVQVAGDAAACTPLVQQFQPDVILIDLELPGLSGKDLLLGLASQGVETPVIVIARRGKEADAIQAFRLGASDYLIWPARDTEVVSAMERVFKQVRERRERLSLSRQLQRTNQELQKRVRELTAVFAVGKSITALAPPQALHERILEGGMRVCGADFGWLLIGKEGGRGFELATQRGLDRAHSQAWESGLNALVAASGESISIYGDPIKKFTVISELGQAVLAVPIKLNKQVAGLLVAVRKELRPFTPAEQSLLEATADYASIAFGNLRTVQNLEARVSAREEPGLPAEEAEKAHLQELRDLAAGLSDPLEAALDYTGQLLRGRKGRLPTELQPLVFSIQEKLMLMRRTLLRMSLQGVTTPRNLGVVNLNDLSRQALARFHRQAQQNGLRLGSELSSPPVLAWGDMAILSQALDGLIAYIIQSSQPGGQILLATGKTPDGLPLLQVREMGKGIDPQKIPQLFESAEEPLYAGRQGSAGEAPGLRAIRDSLKACAGKIWVESQPDEGTIFRISLPLPSDHPKS